MDSCYSEDYGAAGLGSRACIVSVCGLRVRGWSLMCLCPCCHISASLMYLSLHSYLCASACSGVREYGYAQRCLCMCVSQLRAVAEKGGHLFVLGRRRKVIDCQKKVLGGEAQKCEGVREKTAEM